MLKKLQKSKSEGFTIIEVMIVLAIAGLIILVVLLAVPALQRNARNTALKNDASAVASGISEYTSNNDGSSPGYINGTGTVNVCATSACAATTTKSTVKVQGNTAVSSVTTAPKTGAGAYVDPGIGKIVVHLGYDCNNTVSPRAAAILYDVETSGTASIKCIDS
jgi:prepilin-type N-terminal cleavage/methylation domain-containing protein